MMRWIASHPRLAVLAIFVLTCFAAAGVVDPRTGGLRLRMDASTASLLPDGDGRADFYASVRERFGEDDSLLVVLASDDLFTRARLRQVVDTTRRIQALPGVHGVLSLATALDVSGDASGIEVGSPLSPLPTSPEELAALRVRLLEHPLWAGTLVSRDGGAAALIVTFDQDERELLESGLPRHVVEVARQGAGDLRVLATGTAYLRLALTEAVLRDLRRMVPTVVGVLFLVLALTMRSVRGVVVPLATIGVGVVWTLGTLGWCGIPLTLVTAVLPPLLLTVGFAYALHVVTVKPGDHGTALLDDVGLAVLFAGLTTAIGFLALVLSPIHAIREFGMLAALGIGYTAVASLTLAPALCTLLPEPSASTSGGFLERGSDWIARFDVRHRRAVIAIAAVVFAAGCVAVAYVQTGMDPVTSFRPEAPERVALERIKERFGGVSPLSVVLEAPRSGAFAEPEMLRQVDALAEWLRADPDVAHVTSVAELLRLLHVSVTGDREAGLPGSRRMASQLLLLAAGPEQRGLIDSRQQSVRLVVRARAEDSATLLPLIERIESRISELPVSGGVTGTFVLLSRAGDALARGQLHSLIAAVGVIYVVLSLMFASARLAAIAFLPNALAIGVFFALLAVAGVPLNPTTGLIACATLGIAVDGTIHYLVHYRAEAQRAGTESGAEALALRAVIRPVTCTALGLCAGFGSMWIAELQDHVHFGWLAAATLGVAWLSLVTLAPAVVSGLRVLGPWDRVVHALGPAPALAAPLFAGLSARDARRVLDGAQLRELPADAQLIGANEDWRALWLVLSGELMVANTRGAVAVPLAKLAPGDVFGLGAEPAPEPCDVVARDDVQLLRIPGATLARLRRRWPRLAARVDANLSRTRGA
jgi:predicted RND superfamily exporter protein